MCVIHTESDSLAKGIRKCLQGRIWSCCCWVAWRGTGGGKGRSSSKNRASGKNPPQVCCFHSSRICWNEGGRINRSGAGFGTVPLRKRCASCREHSCPSCLGAEPCVTLHPSAAFQCPVPPHTQLEFPIPPLLPPCQSQRSFTFVLLLNFQTSMKHSRSPYQKHNTNIPFITTSQTPHTWTLEFSSRNGSCYSWNGY